MVIVLVSGSSRFRALVGEILCCVLGQDALLPYWRSSQVYKWVPANLVLEETLRSTSIPSMVE